MSKIKEYLYELYNLLQEVWMAELEAKQREYEKSRCLLPNDGNDWRRMKL